MRKSGALWSVLAVVLVIWLGGCVPAELFSTPTAVPALVGSRQIVENTLGLREYWRVQFGYIVDDPVTTSGRVVYIDSVNNVPHVRVLDAVNGNLLWEVVGENGGNWVAADAERVYFEDSYDVLHAYVMKDGRSLWERQFSPYRGRWRSPDLHRDILYIRQAGSGEDYLYTLEARTGEILSTESLWTADHFLLFARFPQLELQILTVQSPYTLRAIDPATRQIVWQVEEKPGLFLMPIRWPPVLLDNLLLLELDDDEVLALDAQSGQIRWRSLDPDHPEETRFATGTGAIIIEDTIYALREDARLVRMDARTGQETGYIQFAPPLSEHNPYGGGNVLGLAGDGQMLFVSFGDSQELIALGP